MSEQDIEKLLQKYMAGETSHGEEEQLAVYLRTHDTPPSWQPYRVMLLQPKRSYTLDDLLREEDGAEEYHSIARHRFSLRILRYAAIAAVFCLVAGVSIWLSRKRTVPLDSKPMAQAVTVDAGKEMPQAPTKLAKCIPTRQEIKSKEKRKQKLEEGRRTAVPQKETVGIEADARETVAEKDPTDEEISSDVSEQDEEEMEKAEALAQQRIDYYRHKLRKE